MFFAVPLDLCYHVPKPLSLNNSEVIPHTFKEMKFRTGRGQSRSVHTSRRYLNKLSKEVQRMISKENSSN